MLGKPGATQRELAEATHMNLATVNKVLNEMLANGHVRRIGVGRQTPFEVTPAGRRTLQAGEDIEDILG
jgi:DNA-binding MarR family transcriptional regulator